MGGAASGVSGRHGLRKRDFTYQATVDVASIRIRLQPLSVTISGWSNSEAPPRTAELCGSVGVSVQVSASSQLTAVAVGGPHGAGRDGE